MRGQVLTLATLTAISLALIAFSVIGLLAPVEGLAAWPIHTIQGLVNGLVMDVVSFSDNLANLQNLQERNRELEEALAALQSEVVELREIAHDYERLAALLDYATSTTGREYVTADVIGRDTSGFVRVIFINKGARDGIQRGMPVVTELGLVGQVTRVGAAASEVLLVTDPASAVGARLQTSRVEGIVLGQLTGALRMSMIPLDAEIVEGDTVLTSGIGGNFPPDIPIGQVSSIRQYEFELYQEAEVRPFNDFDRLEFVLVITSFQPVDLGEFEEPR